MRSALAVLLAVALLGGCASVPPSNTSNLCEIFREKDGWYDDAKRASKRWNSPIPIMMAIMYQESAFVAKAKPPRKYFLWIFPAGRLSTAYGYSQAKTSTWDWYRKSSGNRGADRDDYDDAIDFIGWYNNVSRKINGIAREDAYNLYLAYHEGHGGFKRKTYRKKAWLVKVAKRVSQRATRYQGQLASCREELESNWFFGLF